MKILIIGGSGFIGKYLSEYFAKFGHHVISTYSKSAPLSNQNSINWVNVKLPNLQHELFDNIDVLINLATTSSLSVNQSISEYIQTNIVSVNNICQFAVTHNVKKFIHFSSVTAVGSYHSKELHSINLCNEPNLYGATKFMGEQVVRQYVGELTDTVIVRPPGVVGKSYFSCWIGRVLESLLNNEEILIFNNKNLFNNIVDLYEIARLCDFLISQPVLPEILTLGASVPITVENMIDRMRSMTGSKSNITNKKDDQRPSFVINIDELLDVGFNPKTTLHILENYVNENL